MQVSVCIPSLDILEQCSLIIFITETIHTIWVQAPSTLFSHYKGSQHFLSTLCKECSAYKDLHFSFHRTYHTIHFHGWNGLRPQGQVHFFFEYVNNCEAARPMEDNRCRIWKSCDWQERWDGCNRMKCSMHLPNQPATDNGAGSNGFWSPLSSISVNTVT